MIRVANRPGIDVWRPVSQAGSLLSPNLLTALWKDSARNRRQICKNSFFLTWLVFGDKNDEIRDWFEVRTFLFFGDHYDFGTKIEVYYLFGPPIFLISQTRPRLKKVRRPCIKVSRNGETESW